MNRGVGHLLIGSPLGHLKRSVSRCNAEVGIRGRWAEPVRPSKQGVEGRFGPAGMFLPPLPATRLSDLHYSTIYHLEHASPLGDGLINDGCWSGFRDWNVAFSVQVFGEYPRSASKNLY
jgi:hypothetical protein